MNTVIKLSALCVASALALGTAHAERVIIKHDVNDNEIKQGYQIKTQGEGWFAVELDDNGKHKMRRKRGFKSLEVDVKRFPLALFNDDPGDPTLQQLTPYAVYQSQANLLTLQPGMKVCIIDSGLDMSNADFVWGNVTGSNDPGTGNWFEQGGPHGTHVAGTVAAADNGFGVVGMAPGVALHIVKVFNAAGWGYSSDLAHATDVCTAAGANIITMSLGGGAANSTEENAFNAFEAAGGLVLAAAGNDGNSVRSFPAGYKSVMMIGANDANNNIASFSQFPSNTVTTGRRKKAVTETNDGFGVEVTAGGVDTLSTFPAGLATLSSVTANGVGFTSSAMENQGSAAAATFFMGTAETTNAGANGKICMIDRGVISFQNKVANCQNSGGLGAIIINNVAGVLSGTLGTPNSTTIPAVGAALEDRTALLAATTATVSVGASDYGFMSGTSMATPAVAGVAALVWSNHPTCTGTEIRSALKASAQDQGAPGRDDFFGYGIAKAADANTFLVGQPCGGTPPPGNNPPVASFTANCTLLACSFDASASSDSDGNIVSYNWDFGDGNSASSVSATNTYAADGSYSVSLTVTDNGAATNSTSQTVTVAGAAPPPSNIVLSGTRSTNQRNVTITWSGAVGTNVDIYMDGDLETTTANDGSATLRVNRKKTATFMVCEEGSTTACSSEITL